MRLFELWWGNLQQQKPDSALADNSQTRDPPHTLFCQLSVENASKQIFKVTMVREVWLENYQYLCSWDF